VCVVENDRWGMTTKLVFHRPTAITARRSRILAITEMLFENNNNLKKIQYIKNNNIQRDRKSTSTFLFIYIYFIEIVKNKKKNNNYKTRRA